MSSPRRFQQAFTLIEVMVVVVIVAVVAGITMLAFAQASQRPLRAKARELESWLQDISDRSVLEASTYAVKAGRSRLEPRVWFRQHWFPVTAPEAFEFDDRFLVEFPDAENEENDSDAPELVLDPAASGVVLTLYAPDDDLRFDYAWQEESGQLTLVEPAP